MNDTKDDWKICPHCGKKTANLKKYTLIGGISSMPDARHYSVYNVDSCPACQRELLVYKIKHCFVGIPFFMIPFITLCDLLYFVQSKIPGHSKWRFDARNVFALVFGLFGIGFLLYLIFFV